MESIMRGILFVFFSFLILNGFKATAQNESFLKEFYAYQLNDKIVVKWTISQGNTCNGIGILRSADSINYQEAGFIYGICGSNSSDEPFIFVDSFPYPNQINYYKLDFGGQLPSRVLSVEYIHTGDNDFFIDYTNKPRILFKNQKKEQVKLELYDMQGKRVYTDATTGNKFDFFHSNVPFGIYIFLLQNESINLSGKMLLY